MSSTTAAGPAGVPVRTASNWNAAFWAYFAGVAGGAIMGKMPPSLPILQPLFGLTLVQTGWLAAMFNLIAASAAIFFGLVSDRIGALRFCLFGMGCFVVGGIAGAMSGMDTYSAVLLFASRVLEGLGFVSVTVAAPALIAAATLPAHRGFALGAWSSYMPAGTSAMLVAGAWMISALGWQSMWIATALLGAVCAAMLLSQSREYASATAVKRSLADIRSSLSQPVPWMLGAAFGMYTIQFHAVMVWLPTYLLGTRGASGAQAALLTAGFVAVNVLGSVIGGLMLHRGWRRGHIIGGCFMLTSLLFIGMFTESLPDWLRYALMLSYSVACGPIAASALSGGAKYARTPAEAGAIQGLIVQLTNIGIFAGPPLSATVVTLAGGWHAVLWLILGAAVVGLLMAWLITVQERRAA